MCESNLNQIRYQVGRLGRRFGLNTHDREDLLQDALLEVLAAAPRYDPARQAKFSTFAAGVVANWTLEQSRRLTRARKVRGLEERGVPLDEIPASEQVSHRDLAESLAELDAQDAALCFELGRKSQADIARERGVNRGTVSRQVAQIRRELREDGVIFGMARNTGPARAEKSLGRPRSPRPHPGDSPCPTSSRSTRPGSTRR